ncbi:MAG: hypothetical protein ACP5MG_04900 [Verrucomicrobiia bacterium]
MRDKEQNNDGDDIWLRVVLKQRYKEEELPPGFHSAVWKRITSATPAETLGWTLLNMLNFALRPQTVAYLLLIAVLAGFGVGYFNGKMAVKKAAQSQYIEYVIPSELR